jgi:lysophospholipase L1-like esterase
MRARHRHNPAERLRTAEMPFLSSLLAAAQAAASPPPAAAPPPATPALSGREALAPFYAKLREARDRPVHILQIGDSHTSADAISNGLRAPLQARFGDAGRGVLAPGRPYQNYVTWNVTASQSAGWSVTSWNAPGAAPLGLSGFTQGTSRAGETIGLAADAPEHAFDRLTVCAVTGPGMGTLSLRLGETGESWPLEAPVRGAACHSIAASAPVQAAMIVTADDRPVAITSLAISRQGGGIIVSNLGQIGAQLANFARSDERVLRAELGTYRPDLIVLAFGTNEGFDRRLVMADYEAGLRAQVARLRRLAGPGVPILIVGPPAVLGRNAERNAGDCGAGWYVPALLPRIREAQRALARAQGLAFWDWERAMGGRCAAGAWHAAGLMRDDHIHFNRDGGGRIGRMLLADLIGETDLRR